MFKEYGFDDGDAYEADEDLYNQFSMTSINASAHSKTFRRPTFIRKQDIKFNKDNTVTYKTAQEALSEVKQFLCLLYGSAIRFYNTELSIEVLE